MSILFVVDVFGESEWRLGDEAVPLEFWPYTTIVTDTILELPREKVSDLQARLITQFNEAGIKAYTDNKTAFGVKDENGRIWYIGFKDFRCVLGTGIRTDSWNKAVRKSE